MKRFLLILSCIVLLSPNCRKNKNDVEKELAELPPITQTGAKTFGCLLNGKAWVPKGFVRFPNFLVIVDPYLADGTISIRTYRVSAGIIEDLTINSDSIAGVGTYPITDSSHTRIIFQKNTSDFSKNICDILFDDRHARNGWLKITRYDLTNGIIAGEFEVTMVNRDCGYGDTIRITNGRFDYRFN